MLLLGIILGLTTPQTKISEKKNTLVSTTLACRQSPVTLPTLTPKVAAFPPAAHAQEQGYCLTVPVLLYHRVQPISLAKTVGQASISVDSGIFDQQMQYLSEHGYTAITALDLVNALKNKTAVPAKSVVITFDDGYKNHFEYVLPVLQKYHLIGNFMISAGLLGNSEYMSWSDVETMARSGLAYFTDHTWSHYSINHGTTDKIQYEIMVAKQQLEQHTGQKMDVFTYPYGSFNDNAIALLKQDSFSGAFSTIGGTVQCDSFIMTLHRTHIGNAPLSSYGL